MWNTLNIPKTIKENMTDVKVLTAEEVARYLRIHPYTVKRLARTGKLPGFKVGGQWRFHKAEINNGSNDVNKDKK